MNILLSLRQAVPRIPGISFAPINWQIQRGEIWSIVGENGSGKTLLAETISGKYGWSEGDVSFLFTVKNPVRLVSFNSAYSIVDFREMYYQQRFNSTETESSPSVRELLLCSKTEHPVAPEVIQMLGIGNLMDRKLIHLSSGELRKLLIALQVSENPELLIFDHPFIGLDATSRELINDLFENLSRRGISLLFLAPSVTDLPACTQKVLEMARFSIVTETTATQLKAKQQTSLLPAAHIHWRSFRPVAESASPEVVRMENLEISYGTRIIREGVNWVIKKGEKWALLGPNGSGKSTLLSYIFADNPQAYAKNLFLFGRKRGSGESIWDIKSRIGFTSSEMHLYYRENVPALSVVASGFFDSVGLFRKCTEEQLGIAHQIFELLEAAHLKRTPFLKLSSGEQRLVLFARALVKNPELLILDEPFHGMDSRKKQLCRQIVESYCSQPDKTLIYVTHRREEIPDSINRFMEL